MGDLPGSPSVAPSPLFCAARRGRSSRALMRNRACSTVNWVTCCVFISFCGAGLVICRFVTESRERGDRWSIKGGGERTEGNGDSLETAPREIRERGADLSSWSEVTSGITVRNGGDVLRQWAMNLGPFASLLRR
jgi:hypothetical protein